MTSASDSHACVLEAEIVRVGDYPRGPREQLDAALVRACAEVEAIDGGPDSAPFTRTSGGGVVGRCAPEAALDVALGLRAGVGAVAVGPPARLYVSVGLALAPHLGEDETGLSTAGQRARAGLRSLREGRPEPRTAVLSGIAEFDLLLASMTLLADLAYRRWTREQWEVIGPRQRGLNLRDIGDRLGIGYPDVLDRLRAADWETHAIALQRFRRAMARGLLDGLMVPLQGP